MKDRVSTYPGRVQLTPVSGQTNVYDLVRADQPTEEGTPLNKANLFSDSVADFLNMSSDGTVNDALKRLGAELVYTDIVTSGTWKVPANIVGNKIFVMAVGGGGSGGGGKASSTNTGGGGGSGHIAYGTLTVAPNQSFSVTIGAGGAGLGTSVYTNGNAGGQTKFGTLTANGGEGGYNATQTSSVSGQGGSGGAGGGGSSGASGNYGAGGAASFGGGGGGYVNATAGGKGGTFGGGGSGKIGGAKGTYGGAGGKVNYTQSSATAGTKGTAYNGGIRLWVLAADYYGVDLGLSEAIHNEYTFYKGSGGGGLGSYSPPQGATASNPTNVQSTNYGSGGGGFLANGYAGKNSVWCGGGGLFCSGVGQNKVIQSSGAGGFFAEGDSGLRGSGGSGVSRTEVGKSGGDGVVGIWYYAYPTTRYLSELY